MDLYGKLGIEGWPKTVQYALIGSLAAGYNVLLVGKPGSNKTRFIKNFGALLGKKTRIYDVDKLSVDALMGELNPEFVGQTAKALGSVATAIEAAAQGLAAPPNRGAHHVTGEQFINSVCDYEVIGWDEVLRGHPASQQSLMLNIMQDRTFQGNHVGALQISCTNTEFDELFEFNEALLNRYHLIFQCPSLSDMPHEIQDRLIDSSGHGKFSDNVAPDPEFQDMFAQLKDVLSKKANPDLDRTVKHFVKHLRHPLAVALGDRLSGRALDHIIKVLYATVLTYMVVEGVPWRQIKLESMRDLLRDSFMSTIYLNDLSKEQLNQVRNSFIVAFLHTFDIEELSLRDRLMSVPSFLVNAEDFVRHINGVPEDKQDIGGIAVFVDKLRRECRNDEPLRYILYKWLVSKIQGRVVKIEEDLIGPIQRQLSIMEKQMAQHLESKAEVHLTSDTLGAEFLTRVQQASADRVFSSVPVDSDLYAGLITTVMCFDSEAPQKKPEYVQELYIKYASLRRI